MEKFMPNQTQLMYEATQIYSTCIHPV